MKCFNLNSYVYLPRYLGRIATYKYTKQAQLIESRHHVIKTLVHTQVNRLRARSSVQLL